MSQPAPEITVTHVTSADDFASIVAIDKKAFGYLPMSSLMFPSTVSDAEKIREHQQCWSLDPTTRFQKACLPDGTIIGFARWNFFLKSTAEDMMDFELPAGSNKELCEFFFGGMAKFRKERTQGKEHFLMTILAVDPLYQRMGVGARLLEWGLQEADREGVESWINASPYGIGLYKKFGWEECGTLDVELEKIWGEDRGGDDSCDHGEATERSEGVRESS
jgi:GNAT superfamily N-acetyltransferase